MITYADIQKVYMNERSSNELQRIDDCFYYDAAELLAKIDEEHREAIRKKFYEIFERRRNKIVFAALRSAQKEPANMVPEEKRFYAKIAKDLEDYRAILSGGEGKPKENVPSRLDVKKTRIRFLTQFPSIIGSDMVHYGPFKEGDSADLPSDNAKILIEEGAAEEA